MATIEVWLNINGQDTARDLESAREKLDSADGELVLDCSSVHRIDPSALSAMEKLADAAQDKQIKLVLRGVSVEVYKVLKLVRLTSKFAFVG